MKETQKLLIYSLISIFFFSITGCKKYEDGPFISLRTKRVRVAGDWNVVSLTNAFGDDLLSYHTTEQIQEVTIESDISKIIEFEIEKSGHFRMKIQERYNTHTDMGGVVSEEVLNYTKLDLGRWDFSKDKESLNFIPEDPYTSYFIDLMDAPQFIVEVSLRISRLTNKEFNFVDDFGNSWQLEKK